MRSLNLVRFHPSCDWIITSSNTTTIRKFFHSSILYQPHFTIMVSVQYTEGSDSPPVPLFQRRQLIVNVADGLARNRPQGTYGYLPVSAFGYEKGFRRVSYKQFANMVNGLAWWLTATLGRSSSFEAITYVGPNDFVHNAMVLASVKCGYKVCSLPTHSEQTLT